MTFSGLTATSASSRWSDARLRAPVIDAAGVKRRNSSLVRGAKSQETQAGVVAWFDQR
ncbi:hypothetical protein N5C84_05760 [Klebsiella pneumoniae]|nr:hypothetical protein [Klebsiella pneumoniae]